MDITTPCKFTWLDDTYGPQALGIPMASVATADDFERRLLAMADRDSAVEDARLSPALPDMDRRFLAVESNLSALQIKLITLDGDLQSATTLCRCLRSMPAASGRCRQTACRLPPVDADLGFSSPQVPVVGMRVMLRGLQSAARNGCLARIVSVDTERAGVALDCGRRLAIRYDNLYLIGCGSPENVNKCDKWFL